MIRTRACVFFSFFLIFIASMPVIAQQKTVADTQYVYTDLAKALENPERVYKLRLKKKKLSTFPVEIFRFSNLTSLDLSHNQITTIPTDINKLTKLRRLILNNNEIVALPVQIGELKDLNYLDLWSNELAYFPDELSNIKGNLKTMDLRGILIDDDQQKKIRQLLPETKIFFSPGCNCGK